MQALTANQLSFISAVIARAATSRAWGTAITLTGKGPAVQEIQCLQIGTQLYVAGNHAEHEAVLDYFDAFGVRDDDTFADCIRYSHWLLTLPHTDQRDAVGANYTLKFSEQELAALALAGANPFGDLTGPQIAAVPGLVAGTDTSNPALSWFLCKFIGKKPKTDMAGRYVRSTGTHYGTAGKKAMHNTTHAVTVVTDVGDVHAELKLLAFLARSLMQHQSHLGNKTIPLGGLKKTCAFCAAWVGYYQRWVSVQFRVTVALPTGDTRPTGGGAGKRPLESTPGFGEYVKALFSGIDNDHCRDVKDHEDDEAW